LTTRMEENTLLDYSAMVKGRGILNAKKGVTKTKDCHVPSLTKVLNNTSKIVITCLSTLLIACEPLIFGGISGRGGSTSVAVAQCASGPADLSGACRNMAALTPGALEPIEPGTSAVALYVASTAQPVQTGSILNIAWSPYPGSATGYYVYYGPTSDTATNLASDLPIGVSNLNTSAPSVSYQPALDLGLNTGDSVCFRILAYDTARVPYTWSEVQCTVV